VTEAAEPIAASTLASDVISASASAPAPLPNKPMLTTTKLAVALFSPSASTSSEAPTSVPSNSALVPPPTLAVGSISTTEIRPEPAPPGALAEAVLLLVASTLTGAPGTVITEVAPTSASTLASLVTSAYALSPAPAPINPIEIASAFEVAVLDPFAKT